MEPHITFLLHQTVCLMDAVADTMLKERFNISYRRFYFLLKVSAASQSTQHELTTLLGYSDAAVSRMASQLQRAGLLEIEKDPDHARRNQVSLTPAGVDLVQKATRMLVSEFDKQMSSSHLNLEQYYRTTMHMQQVLESNK